MKKYIMIFLIAIFIIPITKIEAWGEEVLPIDTIYYDSRMSLIQMNEYLSKINISKIDENNEYYEILKEYENQEYIAILYGERFEIYIGKIKVKTNEYFNNSNYNITYQSDEIIKKITYTNKIKTGETTIEENTQFANQTYPYIANWTMYTNKEYFEWYNEEYNTYKYFGGAYLINKNDILIYYDNIEKKWLFNSINKQKENEIELKENEYIELNGNFKQVKAYFKAEENRKCYYKIDEEEEIETECNEELELLTENVKYYISFYIKNENNEIIKENVFNKINISELYFTFDQYINGDGKYNNIVANIENYEKLPENYTIEIKNQDNKNIEYNQIIETNYNSLYMKIYENSIIYIKIKDENNIIILEGKYVANFLNENNPIYEENENIFNYLKELLPDLSKISELVNNNISLIFKSEIGKIFLIIIAFSVSIIIFKIFKR